MRACSFLASLSVSLSVWGVGSNSGGDDGEGGTGGRESINEGEKVELVDWSMEGSEGASSLEECGRASKSSVSASGLGDTARISSSGSSTSLFTTWPSRC